MLRRSFRVIRCRDWAFFIRGCVFHSSANRVLCSSRDRYLPNPQIPTPISKVLSHDADILLEQIRKANTTERVLELTSMHSDVMNGKHVITSLEMIHDISKDKQERKELTDNRIFQQLCARLMKIIRTLDSQEILTSFKILSNLGIHNNTYVIQSLLKMLGAHLNNMTVNQLTFLSFLLSKQRHNSLVDGLRLALPLVLQAQLEAQLDTDNMTQLVDCLQLACRTRLKPVTVEKIVGVVLEKAKFLSSVHATTVIFALLNLDVPVDGYKELINYAFENVSQNITNSSQRQLLNILRLCKTQTFYHAGFFFAVSKRIVSENWNLEATYDALTHFHRLGFAPNELIDHFCEVIEAESEFLKSVATFSPLNCVEFLNMTGHTPKNVDKALDIICGFEHKLTEMANVRPILLLKFVKCTATLGFFPEDILRKVLNEDFLFDSWSYCKKNGRTQDFERGILSLLWSFEVFDKKDEYSLPQSVLRKLLNTIHERQKDSGNPLERFIENGLGGSQFLLSNVFTNDGIAIDHVVAMRSGNYPVSLSTSDSSKRLLFMEDIQLPADSKIIAIIVASDDMYCRDPEVLKRSVELKLKCLAKKQCSPVVIHYTNWQNMPDREKVPYLMQQIKLAFQEEHETKLNSLS